VVTESDEPLTTIVERAPVDAKTSDVAKGTEDSKGAEPVADDEDKVFGEGVFKAHKFYCFTK